VQHPLGTQVLVDVRPMDTLAITDERVLGSLSRRRVGKPPGPHKRHADDATVDEIRGDCLVRNLDAADSRFSSYRSAHARPR